MASLIEILPLGALTTVAAVAQYYYLVFAVLTIVGGVIGFVKAKSLASIISGSISAAVLVAASIMLYEKRPILAGVIALCVSVLLAGKFVPDFMHKKALVPAGLMAVLSLASIILSILVLKR
jgi:uncharacterized membrane protein (UPF0136 family)